MSSDRSPHRPLRAVLALGLAAAAAAGLATGCSRENTLVLGRVEARVAGHVVVVTDCYRLRAPQPVVTRRDGRTVARYAPCRDADVVLRDDSLVVNGSPYGRVAAGDTIVVDHGSVRVGGREAAPQVGVLDSPGRGSDNSGPPHPGLAP